MNNAPPSGHEGDYSLSREKTRDEPAGTREARRPGTFTQPSGPACSTGRCRSPLLRPRQPLTRARAIRQIRLAARAVPDGEYLDTASRFIHPIEDPVGATEDLPCPPGVIAV